MDILALLALLAILPILVVLAMLVILALLAILVVLAILVILAILGLLVILATVWCYLARSIFILASLMDGCSLTNCAGLSGGYQSLQCSVV